MKFDVCARLTRPNGFTLDAAFACETEALAIVGPSGSGKSTLLNAIAGIEPGARVVLDGRDRSGVALHERNIGYVTQDALLFPHLPVRANLLYSPRAAAGGALEKTARALGIAHLLDRMPRTLSGGERRRTALARALLSRPDLLLLDEPFAGLDEPRRREAMGLLHDVRRRFGLPMVLVSHLADEVIGLAGWALRLEDGRLAASGPPTSVLRAGETRIDNILVGRVAGPGRVRVGGVELAVLLPPRAEGEVRLGCYAHDILLATRMPEGLSARNCFWTAVAAVDETPAAIVLTLADPPLRAVVTPEAELSLGLKPGDRVVAILKSTSIAYLGNA